MSNKNNSIENAVLGFVPQENLQDQLGVGTHTVTVVEYRVTHSREQWDGSPKENLPEFEDATPQLGVMFRNDKGIAFHRFNMYGYARWEDLSDKQQASGKYHKVQFGNRLYACEEKNGSLIRVRDPKRCRDAESFVNQFVSAVGMTGKPLGESLPLMVSDKVELNIVVENDPYEGSDYAAVKSFRKAAELVNDEM